MNNTHENADVEQSTKDAVHTYITKYVSRCEEHGLHENTTIHALIAARMNKLIKAGRIDATAGTDFIVRVAPEYFPESERQNAQDELLIKQLGKISNKKHPILFVDLTGCDYYVENPDKCTQETGLRLSAEQYAQAIMKYKHPKAVIILYREYSSYERFMQLIDKVKLGHSWKMDNHLAYTNMLVCEQQGTFNFPNEKADTTHTYKAAFLICNTKVNLKSRSIERSSR